MFVLGLGWIGVVVGLFDQRARLLAWSVLAITLAQLAFIPLVRYMYPLTPVTIVLAAWVVFAAWPWRPSSAV